MENINNKSNANGEAKGVIPRSAFYSYVSKFTKEAINTLVEQMRKSRNPSVKIGAAKAILERSLPELKAVQINPESKTEKFRVLGGGYSAPGSLTDKLQKKLPNPNPEIYIPFIEFETET